MNPHPTRRAALLLALVAPLAACSVLPDRPYQEVQRFALAPERPQRARASRRYIWGMEYFSEMGEEIAYRGRQGLLWKADFCKLYLERFPDLRVVRQQRYPRRDGANQDIMFLLERAG
jgi:hypothetical protein